MTDATSVINWIHKNWPVQARRYILPEVLAGQSGYFRLELPPVEEDMSQWPRKRCMIRKWKVACDSTGFDLWIGTKEGATIDDIETQVIWTGINKFDQDTKETQIFINQDNPQTGYLYCRIVNNQNDSGPINLELYVT